MSDPSGSSAGSLASVFVFVNIRERVEIKQWFCLAPPPCIDPRWIDDSLSIQIGAFPLWFNVV